MRYCLHGRTQQGCPPVAFSQNFENRFLKNANRFLSFICKLYMFYLKIQMFNINDLYGRRNILKCFNTHVS